MRIIGAAEGVIMATIIPVHMGLGQEADRSVVNRTLPVFFVDKRLLDYRRLVSLRPQS
jgi:hypothetical protein